MGLGVHEHDLSGYWGPVTATIDWCESNYVLSHYIAEFWNTVSNLALVLAGLYGLYQSVKQGHELRFHIQYILITLIGAGSAMFHATLRHFEQQCDETPMVLGALSSFYTQFCEDWDHHPVLRITVPVGLVLYGLVFARLHHLHRWTTGFQIHFVVWMSILLWRSVKVYRNPRMAVIRPVFRNMWAVLVVAVICWQLDYHLCEQIQRAPMPNPQGHAWWHVLMGYHVYAGPVLNMYARAAQLGRKPRLVYKARGLLPVCLLGDADGPDGVQMAAADGHLNNTPKGKLD